jgi:hypothetical protein
MPPAARRPRLPRRGHARWCWSSSTASTLYGERVEVKDAEGPPTVFLLVLRFQILVHILDARDVLDRALFARPFQYQVSRDYVRGNGAWQATLADMKTARCGGTSQLLLNRASDTTQ